MKNSLRLLIYYYVTVGLTACGGSFEAHLSSWQPIESVQGGIIVPSTDRLSEDCLTSSEFDSCIFQKSPSAQENQIFSSALTSSTSGVRKFGIKLTSLDSSGLLKNPNLQVLTLNGTRVQTSLATNLKPSTLDTDNHLEQIMTYYWLNRAFEFYQGQTGGLSSAGRNLKVIVDDTIAGFRPATNTIHLSTSDTRLPMALDSSIALYYLGQANVYWASEGYINDFREDSSHRSCNGDGHGCCKTEVGCSRALLYGSSDYFVATLFPNSPKLAETWSQNLSGQELCGQSRSLESTKNLTVTGAFKLCSESDLKGQAQLMGLVYASIWWEVRLKLAKLSPGEVPNIDRLHMEHLKKLTGATRFDTALKLITDADSSLFKTRYSELFKAEFRRRGL